jgi:predicted signal transduction protein with EAL and GGDEF domain
MKSRAIPHGGDATTPRSAEADTAAAEEIADRLLQTLRAPSPDEPPLDASIGLAVAGHGWNAEDLVRAADAAMCAAKAGGKGQLRLYDEILAASSGREALLGDLEHALTRRELRVQYQPLVDLRTRRVTAVEALLRWHHPVRGRIAPLSVSVNVSAAQLADPGAVDALADVIARTGIDPERLTLEVTESVLIADLETTAFQMRHLAALGVPLSIDDFGAGYAGLGYLRDPAGRRAQDRQVLRRRGRVNIPQRVARADYPDDERPAGPAHRRREHRA